MQYTEINKKISKYEKASKTDDEVRKEMKEEINENNLALGLVPVVGDGVKITLNDAPASLPL